MYRRLCISLSLLVTLLLAGCRGDFLLPDQADSLPAEGSKISIASLINREITTRSYIVEGRYYGYDAAEGSFMVSDDTGRIKIKGADNISDWTEIFGKEGTVAVSGKLRIDGDEGRTVYSLGDSHIEDVTTNVLIFLAAGFNNLYPDIQGNLTQMINSAVPNRDSPCKLVVVSHFATNYAYTPPQEIVVEQISMDLGKGIERDTLFHTSAATLLDPAVMNTALTVVKDRFPAAAFGMLLSSHGTGWMPPGYYGSSTSTILFSNHRRSGTQGLVPYRKNTGEGPRVKTFGAEVYLKDGSKLSQEMDIAALAAAIPMHLDYMIFDACLMGSVEVVYELRDVADMICASPAEVLSYGFDYSASELLLSRNPSPEGFCEAYFKHYDKMTGINRSATISVVRTDALGGLASVCRDLTAKYRTQISALDAYSNVQRYYRYDWHWIYDFEDVFVKAGIDAEEKARLDAALDACIIYKATTPAFLKSYGGFEINTYSGLSMYLPGAGDSALNASYRQTAWNKAIQLVE